MKPASIENLTDLTFSYQLYDLYTEDINHLRSAIGRVGDFVNPVDSLRGPLQAVIFEMAANALKALYKRAYFEYMLIPLGMDDLPYPDWLDLFRTEIQVHRAENFSYLCREKGISIHVTGTLHDKNIFRIDVANDGVPTEPEWKRIQSSLETARQLESLIPILELEREDGSQEGAGLGLPLIIMSLKGAGIDPGNFSLFVEGMKTVARLDIPIEFDPVAASEPLRVMNRNKETLAHVWSLFRQIDLSIIRFDLNGVPLSASKHMLANLRIPPDRYEEFRTLLPEKMLQDLFQGPQSVKNIKRISNYRIYVDTFDKKERILFNVSGILEGNAVNTLWQEVTLSGKGLQLDEGTFNGNLKLHAILAPYIPQLVLAKAREMAEIGRRTMPEEVKEITVMFADLVGFTAKSESMRPQMVVELLNLVHNTMVMSIKRFKGTVDKFMGDAVMALFDLPEHACAAAIEIQNNFRVINEFRKEAGDESILLRIGINTGSVIMADIGTEERRDWTALGDTVNTASRIEKKAQPGSILISDASLQKANGLIRRRNRYILKVKGKKDTIMVHTITSVFFTNNGSTQELSMIYDETS